MKSQPTSTELQDPKFRSFERRIFGLRLLRFSLRGIWVAVLLALVWVLLDWFAISYTSPLWIAGLIFAGVLVGAFWAIIRPISRQKVCESIDRRANLKDRLTTAAELSNSEPGSSEFVSALMLDSQNSLSQLEPAKVFPLRFFKSDVGLVLALILVAGIYWGGNSGILVPAAKAAAADQMKSEAERLAELRKKILDDSSKQNSTSKELQQLDRELLKLQKDLEKQRLDPKTATLRIEELQKKAEIAANVKFDQALARLEKSETAFDKLLQKDLENQGIDMESMTASQKQDLGLSNEEFNRKKESLKDAKAAAEKRQEKLTNDLNQIEQKLQSKNLSAEERKALEKMKNSITSEMQQLSEEIKEAENQIQALQLSERARETLKKIMEDPLYKEAAELMAKMNQAIQEASKSQKRPEVSQEQLEEIRKKIEELLKELENADARRQFLEELLESIKDAKQGGSCDGMCLGLGPGMLPNAGQPSGSGGENDVMPFDTQVNRKQAPKQSKGTAQPVFAPSERNDAQPGLEMSYEIKAPTFKGTNARVPYQKVLPSYTQKAENAISKRQIPTKHQQRVKRYFDSLKK